MSARDSIHHTSTPDLIFADNWTCEKATCHGSKPWKLAVRKVDERAVCREFRGRGILNLVNDKWTLLQQKKFITPSAKVLACGQPEEDQNVVPKLLGLLCTWHGGLVGSYHIHSHRWKSRTRDRSRVWRRTRKTCCFKFACCTFCSFFFFYWCIRNEEEKKKLKWKSKLYVRAC